ncbi:MAG TPA: hypothetical protein VJU86_21955 [Pyrinomonadaceae bacterium]|nr:hypothetical protein [Pyrinomonadaceae bacterium]
MRTFRFISLILLLVSGISAAYTQSPATSSDKTEVNDAAAGQQLIGRHKFQLHWISWGKWKDLADLSVTNRGGVYFIKARQAKGEDYVEIDGRVVSADAKEFTFNGKIVTRVSYKNEGKPCLREGVMTFKIVGKRKYWRLQEMQSPCDETTDYVDIFLR